MNNKNSVFVKGNTLGTGRPKGSLNVVTQVIRDRFTDLVEDNTDQIQGWLDEIGKKNPARAMELLLKLTEFVMPKKFETKVEVHQRVEKVNININRNE